MYHIWCVIFVLTVLCDWTFHRSNIWGTRSTPQLTRDQRQKCPSNSCRCIVIVVSLTSFNRTPCFLRLLIRPLTWRTSYGFCTTQSLSVYRVVTQVESDTDTSAHVHTPGNVYRRGNSRFLPPVLSKSVLEQHLSIQFITTDKTKLVGEKVDYDMPIWVTITDTPPVYKYYRGGGGRGTYGLKSTISDVMRVWTQKRYLCCHTHLDTSDSRTETVPGKVRSLVGKFIFYLWFILQQDKKKTKDEGKQCHAKTMKSKKNR